MKKLSHPTTQDTDEQKPSIYHDDHTAYYYSVKISKTLENFQKTKPE